MSFGTVRWPIEELTLGACSCSLFTLTAEILLLGTFHLLRNKLGVGGGVRPIMTEFMTRGEERREKRKRKGREKEGKRGGKERREKRKREGREKEERAHNNYSKSNCFGRVPSKNPFAWVGGGLGGAETFRNSLRGGGSRSPKSALRN